MSTGTPTGYTALEQKLIQALRVMVDHAEETYPHFESERGQRDIAKAKRAIAHAEGRATP